MIAKWPPEPVGREIINPLIRESAKTSLDSVAELTINALDVK